MYGDCFGSCVIFLGERMCIIIVIIYGKVEVDLIRMFVLCVCKFVIVVVWDECLYGVGSWRWFFVMGFGYIFW